MKKFPSSCRRFAMGCVLLLSFALGLGCAKQDSTSENGMPTSPDQTTLPPASQPPPALRRPAAPPAAPVRVAAQPDVNATLQALSLELRKYVVRTRTVPRSFEEFVERARVQAPPPPPGKKYALEGQAVVLVNQ